MDYTYEQLSEYPLRILVPNDSVGAIIGKQGSTVKQIKQTTHARVDVNRGTSSMNSERVIVIRGQLDNCIQACREIMQIMITDAKNKNKNMDVILKVLAHNHFIGRIIGKGGNIINGLKKETDTNITVSSLNDVNSNDIERVISIKGELNQQIRALEMIYTKLCSAFEHDQTRGWSYQTSLSPYYQQQQQQQQLMQYFTLQAAATVPPLIPAHPYTPPTANNNHPTSNSSTIYQSPYYSPIYPAGNSFYFSCPPSSDMLSTFHPYPYIHGNVASQQPYQSPPSQTSPVATETVHLYVPSTMIGAIIGTKGLFVKSIIRNSNASIKITAVNPDEDPNKTLEREIIISGTPEAQWKSQYYIYDKLRQEGFTGEDDVRLRAEINVPTSLIGRLVGKGGQNVRQLQQATGATIKLPDDSQNTTASEIPVKIIGTFQASQFAQRHIQSIIQMSRESNNLLSNNNEQSNELSIMTNGSVNNDDAVVASSVQPNTDHSVAATTTEVQSSTNE